LGGYDKVVPDTIELKWNDNDIRRFLSGRIFSNLKSALNMRSITVSYKKQSLEIGVDDGADNRLKRLLKKFIDYIRRRPVRDEHDARSLDMEDMISRTIILSVFPKEVDHLVEGGVKQRCDLFQYLSDHFNLGEGCTTPRIMLTFLERVVNEASTYF